MNIWRHALLACSFMATLSYSETQMIRDEPERWSSAETMTMGAALGAAEGIACSLSEDLIWWPFSWLLFSEIKTLIAKAIINDAHRNGETLDTSLLNNTSRLSSWITYLSTFNPARIHGRVYFIHLN